MNKKGARNAQVRPTDAMLRVSFLEQCAALLIQRSDGQSDTYNSLSKTYLREMREITYVEQLKLHREAKRNICKKCHRLWLPDKSEKPAIKMRKCGSTILRKCTDCGATKRFVFNTKYRSRNEQN